MRFALCCAAALLTLSPASKASAADPPRKYALLVGCTKYAPEAKFSDLAGPANDVLLMRDLLRTKFQFADADIVTLSEAAAIKQGKDAFRPTRANIEREMKALAGKAREGDYVVVFLSGHGARQPDTKPDDRDPTRFQPDGLEELFAPCDVGPVGPNKHIPNAIADHQLRDWLKAIREKKASVWVVIDACHSASMIRETAVQRGVPVEKLFPPEVLTAAAENAKKLATPRGGPDKRHHIIIEEPDLVALYACQATERAYEYPLLTEGLDSPANKDIGLLTFTLHQILNQAEGKLSYADLIRRIHDYYLTNGRTYPIPVLEGKDRDKQILGVAEFRPDKFHRLTVAGGTWRIDAGSLHGLTPGSVLAVLPTAGQANADKPIGYVEILEKGFGPTRANVQPCKYGDLDVLEEKKLPKVGGQPIARCDLVALNYSNLRLAVAVADRTAKNEAVPAEQLKPLIETLDGIAQTEGSLIRRVDPPAAQWLLQYDSLESGKLYVVPVAGGGAHVVDPKNPTALPPFHGPAPLASRDRWVSERLTRIARVNNLLTVTGGMQARGGKAKNGVKFRVDLVRLRNRSDEGEGQPITPGDDGITLYDGEEIRLTVVNTEVQRMMNTGIDVTVLGVSADYLIEPIFPPRKNLSAHNRIDKGKSLPSQFGVNTETACWERVVVIAVREKYTNTFANFSFLATPELRPKGDILATPLGQLLYAGASKGFASRDPDVESRDYAFQIINWRLLPGPRPKVEKK